MQIYPNIKRFVQETLGCLCPDDVFDEIVCRQDDEGNLRKINVGGRLLIYMLAVNGKSGLQEAVDPLLEQGLQERDRNGFNRFRLVLVTARPGELKRVAEDILAGSEYTDDKVHLHVVSESEVASIRETQEQTA